MARVIKTLDNAVTKLNTLYNSSSTPPSSGEEDYIVWTDLLNVAINLWEDEEGMLWNELFVKLADASDGTKTTDGTNSYTCPSDFKFPNAAYVYVGDIPNATPYKVIRQQDVNLYQNDSSNWCYFLMDTSPTLEFNPNITMSTGDTINYNYYKYATAVSTGSDTFEMHDPMFAVYYALSELKKEEGDASALPLAQQKMEAMKTRNYMVSEGAVSTTQSILDAGFGTLGNFPIPKR